MVMAHRPGACGRLVPTANVATRGGKRCLTIPVFILMAALVLTFQLIRWTDFIGGEDTAKCDDMDGRVTYCGLKWCGSNFDCHQDDAKAFDTAEACELWWSEYKGENDVSCEPYRKGDCYVMNSPFCYPDGAHQLSNGTGFDFYACMGWYVDQCIF